MKKKLLVLLGAVILTSAINTTVAKDLNPEITEAIKLYKAQNYTECYTVLTEYIKNDPSNAVAYYYLAISSTQMGLREDAIDNYNKVLSLVPAKSAIGKYATKGKLCLEDATTCQAEESQANTYQDILGDNFDGNYSKEFKDQYERLKIENLKRDINRGKDIPSNTFKEFKDFSNLNKSEVPTNDEIVAALRTLQRAGLNNIGTDYSDLSLLTGSQNNNFANGLMGGNIDPRVMQALFTNNMSLGF